jgi:5'-nucleotidase
MLSLGKVTIVAPDRNWSACGHVKTLERPLRVKEIPLMEGVLAIETDGAPSDCVALAALGLISDKFDLVVSGINPHANLGHDVTYSGTVTAAMEGAICGVPSLAVSLNSNQAPRHQQIMLPQPGLPVVSLFRFSNTVCHLTLY